MLLYKYYPCDQNTFKSLSGPGLWCHKASGMNDPFECLSGLDFLYSKHELAGFRRSMKAKAETVSNDDLRTILGFNDEEVSDYLNKFRRALIEQYGFCALSEKPDDVLMWSHYAANHSGCAIGIEFPDDQPNLQKVIYGQAPLKPDLTRMADSICGEHDPVMISQMLTNLSVKGPMWSYEKEWRIWRDTPGYWPYDWSQVREVLFGVSCSPEIMYAVANMMEGQGEGFDFRKVEMKYRPLRLE